MKILIIEDEKALSMVLYDKFIREGFDAHVANNGIEGVDMVKKLKPDIVALDMLLPGKNGFKVLEEIKADPALKDIPVFVLSNLGQDEDLKKALQLGAEDYLVKTQHPINEIVEKFKLRLLGKSV